MSEQNGQPLPEDTRKQMEKSFGADFSGVKVHQDSGVPLAEAAGAQAYTVGDHIFFAPGRYVPGTSSGKQLIAHELTHVLHQRTGAPNGGETSKTDEAARKLSSIMAAAGSKAPMIIRRPWKRWGSPSNRSAMRAMTISGCKNI